LDDKPELAKLVASIFGHWASIEQRLSLLLVRVLGADAAPAIAMFSTLIAQHLQMGALQAAAKAALTVHELDSFLAVMSITDSVQTPRNQLAHWIWGACQELPDALLLAEPKAQKERDRETILALEESDRRGFDLDKMMKLNTYDPSTVTVYRKGDLERANRDLAEADESAFLLCIYLDGLFRGRRTVSPGVDLARQRDHIYFQLSEKRL
jgi:hypothetical protein